MLIQTKEFFKEEFLSYFTAIDSKEEMHSFLSKKYMSQLLDRSFRLAFPTLIMHYIEHCLTNMDFNNTRRKNWASEWLYSAWELRQNPIMGADFGRTEVGRFIIKERQEDDIKTLARHNLDNLN